MAFETKIEDRRTITIPAEGLDNAESEQLGKAITAAAQDGYRVVEATADTQERGHQMDPYTVTVSISVVMEKS
jgi:hypothetical protein